MQDYRKRLEKTIESVNAKKHSFYPPEQLSGKSNYCLNFRIEKDGSTTKRVFLEVVDDKTREEIISNHFLRLLAKDILKEDIGVDLISRDSPWDFQFRINKEEVFNVEIVSIADNEWEFKKYTQRERAKKWSCDKVSDQSYIDKMKSWFPYMPEDKLLNWDFSETILVSNIDDPDINLEYKLKDAIDSKNSKIHSDKENTVLIIDNRTWFTKDDFILAANSLEQYFDESVFRDIWLYTGYYSNDDGSNYSCDFLQLKNAHK